MQAWSNRNPGGSIQMKESDENERMYLQWSGLKYMYLQEDKQSKKSVISKKGFVNHLQPKQWLKKNSHLLPDGTLVQRRGRANQCCLWEITGSQITSSLCSLHFVIPNFCPPPSSTLQKSEENKMNLPARQGRKSTSSVIPFRNLLST